MTVTDREQLAERGIGEDEIDRQLALFRRERRFARLVRPCTPGDGIEILSDARVLELAERHAVAEAAGRCTKFVPASGAASRMFRDLLRLRNAEAGAARPEDHLTLRRFLDDLKAFAFYPDLLEFLARDGQDLGSLAAKGKHLPILAALLDTPGLGYAALPKGLLRFHTTPCGGRTPFEEHLIEAAHYARDASGRCRLHFTVSPEHRPGFEELFRTVGFDLGERYKAEFDIGYSVQKPSTDTLAVDPDNQPLRDADGRLIFRPGGHGALIENLSDLGGDLVFIKNIDNVQPDRLKGATLTWKPALAGLLIEQERGASGKRPRRVCGVVPNTGEPGGGPFWVRGADGRVTRQIVESAEVDMDHPDQARIFASSTHFNPVDLVCGVRDPAGRPLDLKRFVDPDAVIVTRKSAGGVDLKALERPGLWNGAMAGWDTTFVEVPLATFSPVKTLLDLLRPEHQG